MPDRKMQENFVMEVVSTLLDKTYVKVEELSDDEILEMAELRMNEAQGKRLGRLLDRQQAGKLDEDGQRELAALAQVYHEGLVRKAQGIAEAVRRGLMEPLGS
ncbi:MAG: hypothetical protein ACREBD_06410 [Blastocatellia bacterium]